VKKKREKKRFPPKSNSRLTTINKQQAGHQKKCKKNFFLSMTSQRNANCFFSETQHSSSSYVETEDDLAPLQKSGSGRDAAADAHKKVIAYPNNFAHSHGLSRSLIL
jgi:hypothetical protein